MISNKPKNESGVAVILTILIMGVLISITMVLTSIFATKIRLSSETKYSVGAFYAAESGIECCLRMMNDGTTDCTSLDATTLDNINATFDLGGTCLAATVKSIGTYKGVTRAIKVDF